MTGRRAIDLTHGVYRRMYAGALRSDKINSLSERAELLFWRLILIADDFGAFRADDASLLIDAVPLRRDWTRDDVRAAMNELTGAALVMRYTHGMDSLACILRWDEFQPAPRNGRRAHRVPPPPGANQPPAPSATPHEPSPPSPPPAMSSHAGAMSPRTLSAMRDEAARLLRRAIPACSPVVSRQIADEMRALGLNAMAIEELWRQWCEGIAPAPPAWAERPWPRFVEDIAALAAGEWIPPHRREHQSRGSGKRAAPALAAASRSPTDDEAAAMRRARDAFASARQKNTERGATTA